MDWIILLIGSFCEVGWLVGMKYAEGFTRFWPSVIMVFFMIASVACLAFAVRTIPAGTAYAVWTGASIAAVAVVGVYLFNEPATPIRLASIALIVVGSYCLSDPNLAPYSTRRIHHLRLIQLRSPHRSRGEWFQTM